MESKTEYSNNDYETVYMINDNSEDAKDYLYRKYSGMIHNELNKVKKSAYALGIDWLDLVQEAMLGFSNAVNSFDDNSEAQFGTYATLCVRRKLLNYIDKHATAKNFALKSAIPLELTDEDTGNDFYYFVKDLDGREPLNKIITEESLGEISEKFDSLNREERLVIEYAIEGKTANEIAELMGITVKRVYNILYRSRKKLKIEQ